MTGLEIAVAGVSHARAPVELRERLHVEPGDGEVHLHHLPRETVVLCTCNRTEVYVAGPPSRALAALSLLTGAGEDELRPVVATATGRDAAAHLFAVAGGLESALVGETQILGQVRDAHRRALEAGRSGRLLGRLFCEAIRTGRRIRTETSFADRPTSLPAAAVRVAEQALGPLEQRRALVIGAGRTAELAALELVHRRVGGLGIVNRTLERAERLAGRFGAVAVPCSRLEEALARADVVVSATSAPGLVVDAELLACRGGEPLLLLDLGVPRDLDPRIAALPGCILHDVDSLARLVAAGLDGRAAELARARAIADERADAFAAWLLSLRAVPAIAALRSRADAIRAAELARAEPQLAALGPRERRLVESLTARIVDKLLHEPTMRLKDAAAGPAYAGAVRHLFALDSEEAA